jgi:hypothetical protein
MKRFAMAMVVSGVVRSAPGAWADQLDTCPAPRTTCGIVESGRVKLQATPVARIYARGWGDAIDFGAPFESTTYRICIFSGNGDVVFAGELPPGSRWDDIRNGVRYRERTGVMHDGVTRFAIKAWRDETAFAVKGSGVGLRLGTFPLDLPVMLQLWTVNNDNGHEDDCLEATFDGPSSNDARHFSSTRR